jgi:dipeptidyl aminopeptidase/acylaminoacyl peptidase
MATIAAVLQQEPPPIGDVRRDVPPELARLIMRCLRKDPAKRVQSMADLKVALDELRDEADSGRLTAATPAAARSARLPIAVLAVSILVLGAAAFLAWRAWRAPSAAAAAPQPMPLTSFAGSEGDPTLSPDGTQFAFRWSGEDNQNHDIYVMLIGGGSPLRLTTDPRGDYGPRWSPDGRRLAFLRILEADRVAVILMPPLGGPERTIHEFFSSRTLTGFPIATVCWTPDSRYLFVSGADKRGQANGIVRMAVDTGETLVVKASPDAGRGFSSPNISPDGRTLAIAQTDAPDALQLVSLSEAFAPQTTKVVPGPRNVYTVHWTPDGRDLLITYFVQVPQPLFRVAVTGGEPAPLSWAGSGVQGELAIHGSRMIYELAVRDTNIVRVDLASAAS